MNGGILDAGGFQHPADGVDRAGPRINCPLFACACKIDIPEHKRGPPVPGPLGKSHQFCRPLKIFGLRCTRSPGARCVGRRFGKCALSGLPRRWLFDPTWSVRRSWQRLPLAYPGLPDRTRKSPTPSPHYRTRSPMRSAPTRKVGAAARYRAGSVRGFFHCGDPSP